MMAEAMRGLQESMWDPAFRALCEKNRLREIDLMYAAVNMIRAMERLGDPSLTELPKALKLTGFHNSSPEAQMVVLARMGQVLLSYYWYGAKSSVKANTVPEALEILSKAGRSYLDTLVAAQPAAACDANMVPPSTPS
jgi:hypothetical protein